MTWMHWFRSKKQPTMTDKTQKEKGGKEVQPTTKKEISAQQKKAEEKAAEAKEKYAELHEEHMKKFNKLSENLQLAIRQDYPGGIPLTILILASK